MFKKILLAVDGSAHGMRAAESAAAIAAAFEGELVLVTVLPDSVTLEQVERMPQADRFAQSVKDDMQRMRDAVERRPASGVVAYSQIPAPYSAVAALGEEILNDVEAIVRGNGATRIARVAASGNPAQQILDQATKHRADLIVMGTRGLTDFGALVLGSVSHKVIHLATCPCLTVK